VTDPAEFLTAALDAAEVAANAATPGPWTVGADDDEVVSTFQCREGCDHEYCQTCYRKPCEVCEGYAWNSRQTRANVTHIAANDPAHVLRMVAAHRKLAGVHKPMDPSWTEVRLNRRIEPLKCNVCAEWDEYEAPVHVPWPCDTLKALAEAYGWTPETS
jgi:hypothetical protein